MNAATPLLAAANRMAFSRQGRQRPRRLAILTFHRVHATTDPLFPLEPDAARFDRLVRLLSRSFRLLTLGAAARALQAGTLPERAMTLTFDDGYRDNVEVAMPILQRHGVPATFFVCTGYLDGGAMWNDRVIEAVRRSAGSSMDLSDFGLGRHDLQDWGTCRQAVGSLLAAIKHRPPAQRAAAVAAIERAGTAGTSGPGPMMTASQVRDLAGAGMEIGAHTVTHPILCRIDDAAARDELERGRRELQAIANVPADVLAYPNGRPGSDYDERHVAMARACGFAYAVSTAPGWAEVSDDPLQLPRLAIWGRNRAEWSARLWLSGRARG